MQLMSLFQQCIGSVWLQGQRTVQLNCVLLMDLKPRPDEDAKKAKS